jgi:hypothetical protein
MSDVRLDDDRLAVVLTSVGDHLLVDGVAVTPAPREMRSRWRLLLVAAVTVAVIAGALVAIAPARRAVSGWLRIGRIELDVDRRTDSTGLPSLTDAARPIEPAEAGGLLGQPIPVLDASSLGVPTHWWTIPEGGIVVGWPDGETSLWITSTAGGEELVDKIVAAESDVAQLPDLADGGAAVRGGHVLLTPHRRVAADGVVIWTDGRLTLRLEGTAELDELIEVAKQLVSAPRSTATNETHLSSAAPRNHRTAGT